MKGLASTAIILIVILAVAGIAAVYFVSQKQTETPSQYQQQPPPSQQPSSAPPECVGKQETDLDLPQSCKNWFDMQKNQGQQPTGTSPSTSGQQTQSTQKSQPTEEISVKSVDSKYKAVSTKPTGWFTTGQDADIMLSGIDFNNAGGPLLFNHPGNIATDGTRLILADRFNNRILIWNKLPTGNETPNLVLGQKDFYANNPGKALDQLNWPVAVSVGGGKLVVGDSYNDRVLIWNSFPTKNGQAADLELNAGWPWAVWTDGEKLIVTATAGAKVLIWNKFPAQNNQVADIVLYAKNNFGTPRSIGSDGKHLIIGDHNAKPNNGKPGNFFWKTFPTTDDQPYDFFVPEVSRMSELVRPENAMGDILWGPTFTKDGKLIGVANTLYVWNSFPENENDAADIVIGAANRDSKVGYDFGGSQSGDGSGIAVAGEKVYVSFYNGNKIVGFNTFPNRSDQKPDFAVGSPDINTNTLKTNYFSTNAVPLTDGKSLFVFSSFDGTMYVWKSLPDESGAKPDFVYTFSPPPHHASIVRNSLVVDNGDNIFVWKKLPLNGEKPDITFNKTISNVDIATISCITGDEKYFYISSAKENKTYVWEDVPIQDTPPKITINTAIGGGGGAGSSGGGGCHNDGTYITAISTFEHRVKIYRIADLISNPNNPPDPMTVGRSGGPFNLPEDALVSNNHLFVADTVNSRVLVWKNFEDAVAGKDADVVLGEENLSEKTPEIGRDKLFWSSGIEFDGSYLWVGEFKFSNRVLRFSVR